MFSQLSPKDFQFSRANPVESDRNYLKRVGKMPGARVAGRHFAVSREVIIPSDEISLREKVENPYTSTASLQINFGSLFFQDIRPSATKIMLSRHISGCLENASVKTIISISSPS